ncbi:MAG: tRNA (adenosine(37)-N6)-threonylcarbamoyltransferase complex dimerization subunit type 1 TsaB [Chloroflexi bacterium]|nr:tRNA (adenosine(37)-N6)-threonylcarbamoyltransferase complex dimerization subunit type 1 TsaB [Chloroflexota bacterium]PKB57547.1 MAG: tRNA (adenosine(37)-N6)-threonylcarbamoyltransferase complex dimerization subunit type 1 TsaB [SAR202 cluster bacterium Casp-Chloro-G3]
MLLAIDTSTRYAGVSIADDEKLLASRGWYSRSSHTAQLMPAISEIMGDLKLALSDLDGIAVALGPGAFSALRVGLSVAKGLAMASKKSLVGIGTLDLEAFPYLGSGLPVCALLDSGRKEVASALFAIDGTRIRDDIISPPDELIPEVTEPTIFCGEGVTNWERVIKETFGGLAIVARPLPAGRICSLIELGKQRLGAGGSDEIALLQPYYLRMPSIGGPKRRDLIPQQS